MDIDNTPPTLTDIPEDTTADCIDNLPSLPKFGPYARR